MVFFNYVGYNTPSRQRRSISFTFGFMAESDTNHGPETVHGELVVRGRAPLSLATASDDGLTFANRLDAFWGAYKSPLTARQYKLGLRDFSRFLKHEDPSWQAGAEAVATAEPRALNAAAFGWVGALNQNGAATSTLHQKVAALRSAAWVAATVGLRTSAEIFVTLPKGPPKQDRRGLTAEQTAIVGRHYEDAIVAATPSEIGPLLRDYAMVRLMVIAGLRRFEITALDVEHFDAVNRTINTIRKNRQDRELHTTGDETAEVLSLWIVERQRLVRHPGGPLFTSFDRSCRGTRLSTNGLWSITEALGKVVGFKIRPHGLRHRAVTAVVRETRKTLLGTALAGHADPKTAMTYLDEKLELAREAVAVNETILRAGIDRTR